MGRASSKSWLLALATAAVLAFAFGYWRLNRPAPATVAYHLERLESLRAGPFLRPRSWTDFLKWKGFAWLYHGRPTYNDWWEAMEQEQEALIKLGYYERRWIHVPTKWNINEPVLKRTEVGKTRYAIHLGAPGLAQIRLTATPADIAEYEKLVRELP